MIKEFRDFIMRGNVLQLAVAFVMGVAFSAITTSLVNDIIMPLVGILMGGVDFASLSVQVGSATVNYGLFIQAIVNFLIIAFAMFLLVKASNRLQAEEPAPEPVTPEDIVLLREIRDQLKQRQD
jgi:large conductance mechanosensitive channel